MKKIYLCDYDIVSGEYIAGRKAAWWILTPLKPTDIKQKYYFHTQYIHKNGASTLAVGW